MLTALLIPLVLAVGVYAVMLLRAAYARRAVPRLEAVALGAITNFFETLGIGSFAPTMAWLKFRRLVPDRLIPCAMIVGHTLPAVVQAIIFLVLLGVLVDPVLLVGCVLATLMGGLVGVSLVIRTRVWIVQLIVGIALILAAVLYIVKSMSLDLLRWLVVCVVLYAAILMLKSAATGRRAAAAADDAVPVAQ
jgi:hypothetical protein